MSEQQRTCVFSSVLILCAVVSVLTVWILALTVSLGATQKQVKAFQTAVNERLKEHGEPPIEVKP